MSRKLFRKSSEKRFNFKIILKMSLNKTQERFYFMHIFISVDNKTTLIDINTRIAYLVEPNSKQLFNLGRVTFTTYVNYNMSMDYSNKLETILASVSTLGDTMVIRSMVSYRGPAPTEPPKI